MAAPVLTPYVAAVAEQLAVLVRAGKTVAEAAALVGCHRVTVAAYLRAAGVVLPRDVCANCAEPLAYYRRGRTDGPRFCRRADCRRADGRWRGRQRYARSQAQRKELRRWS